jgi:hypothetical protein
MIDYSISIKYMVAGYAVIFTVLILYLMSLFFRWKRLKHDLETYENLEDHQ